MGTQSVAQYCREIETYLCQKNDGHLIRIVGPSFDLVSGWAARGVPLKIAFAGIDRYFDRYYRNGPRRRPVRIDFCDADVLDAFDRWLEAVGLTRDPVARGAASGRPHGESREHPRESLAAHLERVVMRLTSARAAGAIDERFDRLIDAVAGELEAARAAPGGVRGEARRALLERLTALDAELVRRVQAGVDPDTLAALERAADAELAPFRAMMAPDAFSEARRAAVNQLLREQLRLPTIAFT